MLWFIKSIVKIYNNNIQLVLVIKNNVTTNTYYFGLSKNHPMDILLKPIIV